MNRFNTLLLVAAATLLLASAYNKANVPVKAEASNNTPAFIGKNLTMTSFQVNPAIDLDADGKLDTDLTIFLRDCDKDNTVTFEKGGVMSGSNGPLSCSANEVAPSIKPSHWTYDPSTKTIRIVKDNDATDVSEWKVLEASGNSLKVEISVTEPTQSYKTITTWKSV
ncbi:hypothetical protein [Spirosoma validum]|uniref:Lipocalin-like domain-containing protein n=1 Tax=Spirosoma validum TaxID=2771355 RepID=A0A927B1H3_9BACT|nr:hypothetical protein [Spirosoma validum]MBD2753644.1 hypothetical protein [Spirosoma validum]